MPKTAGKTCQARSTTHWGRPDPARVEGDDVTRMMAFRTTLRELENRSKIFVNLPIAPLDRLKFRDRLDQIGQAKAAWLPAEQIDGYIAGLIILAAAPLWSAK